MKKIVILGIVLLVLLQLAAIPNSAGMSIDWWTVGPSSRTLTQAGMHLHGMIGQGISGQVNHADFELCSGYLCIPVRLLNLVYLALIYK